MPDQMPDAIAQGLAFLSGSPAPAKRRVVRHAIHTPTESWNVRTQTATAVWTCSCGATGTTTEVGFPWTGQARRDAWAEARAHQDSLR